jgi:hypothetical protein
MEGDPPPIDRGDFVWTNFPTRQEPAYPSSEKHIALCLRRFRGGDKGYVLVAVYTTSRPRGERPKARGEIEITVERAIEYGQKERFELTSSVLLLFRLPPISSPTWKSPGMESRDIRNIWPTSPNVCFDSLSRRRRN